MRPKVELLEHHSNVLSYDLCSLFVKLFVVLVLVDTLHRMTGFTAFSFSLDFSELAEVLIKQFQ